jgi:hypothetical protein
MKVSQMRITPSTPEGTVTVIDVRNGFNQPNTRTVTFRDWNSDGKHAKQIPELKKAWASYFWTGVSIR